MKDKDKKKENKSNTQIYRILKMLIDGPLNRPLKYNLEESDVQTLLCKCKKKANKITNCLVGQSDPIISWGELCDFLKLIA